MAVSLRKTTDTVTPGPYSYLHTRQWHNTVRLAVHLDKIFVPVISDKIYAGMADNDLRALATMLRVQSRTHAVPAR